MKRFGVCLALLLILVMVACGAEYNGQPAVAMEQDERFMADLRENMNLSFKVLHAMDQEDFHALEEKSSDQVKIDRVAKQVVIFSGGEEIRLDFLDGVHFGNAEYRGAGYMEDDRHFQVFFAYYYEDTHGTIEMSFIKEEEEWKFYGFMTNA